MVVPLLPAICRPLACFCKRNIRITPQSHVSALTIELEPENAGFRTRLLIVVGISPVRRDPQVKPAAILQHFRPLRLCNLNRFELANSRHSIPLPFPHHVQDCGI